MKRLFLLIGLSPLVILAASAAPVMDPVEFLRLGNAAYTRRDYAGAVELYNRAEILATDPGLVAFNKAAAFYHLGNSRAAEVLYRASLSDAEGPRRIHLVYGLAN